MPAAHTIAGLARVQTVTAKELAELAGCSAATVRERCLLWEIDPEHPLALPYLRKLGRPFRIRVEEAARFLGAPVEAKP